MSKCLSWHCFLFAELLISAKLVYLLKCCCSYNSKEALIRLVRESLLSCHSQKWMFWPFCESVHWNTIAIYFCPFHSSLGVKALISIYSRSGLVSTNSRGEYVTRTGKTLFALTYHFEMKPGYHHHHQLPNLAVTMQYCLPPGNISQENESWLAIQSGWRPCTCFMSPL